MPEENALPENVEVHKKQKPKNWTYPFKTTDLVESLALGELGEKVRIFYDNSPWRPHHIHNQKREPSKGFPIFSITHYGTNAIRYGKLDDAPYFFVGVNLVKPEYRLQLLQLLKEEAFPVIAQWMKTIRKAGTWNTLSVEYNTRFDQSGGYQSYHLHTALIVKENKERELFVKVIDLDKKEEDGDKVP